MKIPKMPYWSMKHSKQLLYGLLVKRRKHSLTSQETADLYGLSKVLRRMAAKEKP